MNYKDQSRNKIEMKKIIKKNNGAGSLQRSIKLINLQPNSSRKKRESTQIYKIRNEKGEDTTDTTEKIIRDYDKQLHANKKENLGESKKPQKDITFKH